MLYLYLAAIITYVRPPTVLNTSVLRRDPQRVPAPRTTSKQLTSSSSESVAKRSQIRTTNVVPLPFVEPVRARLNLSNPENIIRTSSNNHNFVFVGIPRMKGKCVTCLKNGKKNLERLNTCCDTCPGSNWMCVGCFEELH